MRYAVYDTDLSDSHDDIKEFNIKKYDEPKVRLIPGDIVKYFKKEMLANQLTGDYLYLILNIGTHTETHEKYRFEKVGSL